ncbi:uncharacterized protein LOC114136595 isoform X2 [Xiphophorus couchianus]|uniref:uncharacterized protein LOC114136595 isoform X2 n=1 Tax=Xiphophorus couchianus TaxID=32473 RepID=UPI001016CC04|nr:uncharacterized protein LOC114136595 isoform X2 [Xiphophorus couchianus]
MANTTTTQASYITVEPQADECLENVPPRDPKAVDSSKLENAENFTLQLEEDGADAFVSSTPASKNRTSDFQAKSLLSGVQSALTPVLKDLNIWNKSASPELFKLRNSPNSAVPSNFAANCQKSTRDSRTQKIGEDISMINDECLPEVTLSDLTSDSMLYLTMNDSVFPERQHATPQLYSKKTNTSDHQNSFCAKVDDSFQNAISFRGICNEYLQDITLLEVTRASPVGHMSFMDIEDDRATSDHSDQIMTEKSDTITIEELSSKSGNSPQSSRQNSIKAALEVTQDVTLENSKSSSESSGQKVEKSQNPVNSTQVINVTRDLCSSCDASNSVDISSSGTERSTYEVCPEPRGNPDCIEAEMVTKESQQSPESETGGQKLEMYQSSDTLCIQAINITQEKNPGCDTPVQTARLPADMDKSSPELESEPKEKLEELPTRCDTESTNKESQQTLKPDMSANGTFAVEQPSIQTISIVNNETLDLPPTNVSYAKDVKESGDQQTSVDSKTEASFVVHQSSSDAKETTFAVGQNATVDGDPLQKSKLQIGSAIEKTPAPLGQWNGTFDYKLPSQLNGTITLAEISSNDSHQSALGNSSTSKARNATITLKDGCSENNSSKLQTNEAAAPETKKDGSPNITFEAAEPGTKKDGSPNMTFEAAEPGTKKDGSPNMTFEAAEPGTKKDGSPNMTFEAAEPGTKKDGSPNVTFEDAVPETKKDGSPNMTFEAAEPETKKDGSPNMTFEAAEPGTKKDGSPNMTFEDAVPETKKDGSPNMTFEAAEPETKKDGSPNMTFETPLQPANVSIYLSQSGLSDFDESLVLKPQCLASSTPMVSIKMFTLETKREPGHILAAQKNLYGKTPIEPSNTIKPSNIIGDRKTFFKQPTVKNLYPSSKIASELLKRNPPAAATGLLVKRQRPDGEAAKSSAAPKEQEKNSNSYNLRSLASKLPPPSGLQRPQVSGIPIGLPRATPSLRAAPCSSTEKPSGPAAANFVTKMAPGKRHPLAKGDVLPVSKRKKTDASTTEAPVSVGAASGVKTGKQPTAGHRSALDKSSRTDAAAAKTAASYDVIGRGRGLKQPAANPRANHVKPQSQGCTKCEHLSQEIERLKEVLRKHKIPLNG